MLYTDWKEKSKGLKPDKRLLWDVKPCNVDFHEMKKVYVERVIERRNDRNLYAAINFYGGLENFIKIIKEVHYFSERSIAFVCKAFDLKEEELGCYKRRKRREIFLGIIKPTYPF